MTNVKCVQGLFTAQTLTGRFATYTHATTRYSLSLFYFNICTYRRSLRQIWNYSLSLYVERLVILYFKHHFLSVQSVLLNVCRNDNSTSTVSLAHCNDCYRSFDWGCLVTTIILLASLLWNLWWLARIPSSYLRNFFWGKYYTQKLPAVHILNMFLALFWWVIISSPNTKMLRICLRSMQVSFIAVEYSCAVHKEEICITDFSF